MATFSKALEHLKANTFVKREVIKNDTVIVNYKNRLYQMSTNTGVRYPYVPTNKDLMADDWLALSVRGNVLVDQSVKDDETLRLLDVVGRSEQLKAFADWRDENEDWINHNCKDNNDVIKAYKQSL